MFISQSIPTGSLCDYVIYEHDNISFPLISLFLSFQSNFEAFFEVKTKTFFLKKFFLVT